MNCNDCKIKIDYLLKIEHKYLCKDCILKSIKNKIKYNEKLINELIN
jgi:hypothetical protein